MKSKKKSPNKDLALLQENMELLANNPEEFKALVLKSMPELVKYVENKEDLGTSMYESGQELLLAIEDVLMRYHGFDEAELRTFKGHLDDIMRGVKEFEESNLSILTTNSMTNVGDLVEKKGIAGLLSEIAEVRYKKQKMWKAGLDAPLLAGAEPYIKLQDKKNR